MYFTTNVEDVLAGINAYRNELQSKIELFLNELADIGIAEAKVHVDRARHTPRALPTRDSQNKGVNTGLYNQVNDPTKTDVRAMKSKYSARYRIRINLTGKDVLFVEFSAGKMAPGTMPGGFNPLPSGTPYGDGYGVGTYNPDSLYAFADEGWYFNENGIAYHSFGNIAYAPMYHADEAIVRSVNSIAARIFT